MITVNDVSLAVFMLVVTIVIYYLYRIIRIYLIESDLKYRKEILEMETYLRDISIRIKKMEDEFSELRKIIANITTRRRKLEITKRPSSKLITKEEVYEEKRSKRTILNKTEKEILKLLVKEGGQTSSQIREKLGLSREHVARTLKGLFEKNYVERDETIKPFKYIIREDKMEEIKEIVY